jgi:hypothetical protein
MKKTIKSSTTLWVLVDDSVMEKGGGYVDKTAIFLQESSDWLEHTRVSDVLCALSFDSFEEANEYLQDKIYSKSLNSEDIRICEAQIKTYIKL